MAATERLGWQSRPWGGFLTVYSDHDTTVKILRVNPRSAISLQLHDLREEFWTLASGVVSGVRFTINGVSLTPEPWVRYHVPHHVVHRITNDSDQPVEVIEVIKGQYDENDIVRINDRYGR